MTPQEAACTVANLLVPGLGSVVNALIEVGKLCMEMKENQHACVKVETRFSEIHTQLQLMAQKGTLPKNDALAKYTDLLERFYLFLKKQHNKNVILRLAAAKGVLQKIQDFHEDMDQLFKLLNLAHMDAMASWQQSWEQDKLHQQQQLEMVVGNTGMLLKELHDQRAQVEALTLLKFEVERSGEDAEEVALLKSAFKKVVSVSQVEVQKIPGWFLPPDDVDFNAEPFSRGSFGTVHRGIWGVGTDVVVKCLMDSNERAKESFLKECHIWHGMNHPHVLKMFGACHVSAPPFIVCEYADHGSLDGYLSRKTTTRATTWKLLYQTSLGLEYLHARTIVHGDLKCNNVLVAGDAAKLADFGFSFFCDRASLTSSKPQTGATRWKAPELLLGGTPSLASDVYSFGMCILEAVTGDAPWGMVDDESVRQLVQEGQLPLRPKELDEKVWRLVQQMCCKDPAQRLKLKLVAEQLNKIYLAEQEQQATSISDGDTTDCDRCQFMLAKGTTFCGRCGFHVLGSRTSSSASIIVCDTCSAVRSSSIPVCDECSERGSDPCLGQVVPMDLNGFCPLALDEVRAASENHDLPVEMANIRHQYLEVVRNVHVGMQLAFARACGEVFSANPPNKEQFINERYDIVGS